jgi:hypothetical protein
MTNPGSDAAVSSRKNARTIALCVGVAVLGVGVAALVIRAGLEQLHADEREEVIDLDDRSPAELEAERLAHETEQLAAERVRLQRECAELEERLGALSARAPEMPPIETSVALVDGDEVFLTAGAEDGIERGFQLSIMREKVFVARVVVQVVTPRACACRVLIVKDGEAVRTGDQAFTKSSTR